MLQRRELPLNNCAYSDSLFQLTPNIPRAMKHTDYAQPPRFRFRSIEDQIVAKSPDRPEPNSRQVRVIRLIKRSEAWVLAQDPQTNGNCLQKSVGRVRIIERD
jgi:hypothetical protein